jgi:hypothetical protein
MRVATGAHLIVTPEITNIASAPTVARGEEVVMAG